MIRVLVDELDDPWGDQPYQESPGVWICRRCADEIKHRAAFCRRCRQQRQREQELEEVEEPTDE